MSTYSNQSELPRLPIPKLEETLERFPIRLTALQNTEERKETLKVAEQFLQGGEGLLLQELLLKYEEEGRNAGTLGSFVEEFWNDSYLAPDCSVVLNLNPFFLLEDEPDPDLKTQIGRASSLLFASLKFASMLKNETLSPEEFRGNKLCMDQFKSIFGSCRIPCGDKDIVETDPLSSHVVVMKRNCMYYFQGLWPEDGSVAVTRQDIVEILNAIEKDSLEHHANLETLAPQGFGVLTTMERRFWAKARQEMSSFSAHNHAALRIIDSALFILVLDDFIPKSVDEAVANMLHGTYQLHQSSENMKQYQVIILKVCFQFSCTCWITSFCKCIVQYQYLFCFFFCC